MPKTVGDFKENAARKNVPRTSDAWSREVDGVRRFVEQSPKLKDEQGKAWLKSMQRYYRARLLILKANPPPGVRRGKGMKYLNDVLEKLPE